MDEILWTVDEAAQKLRLSKRTIADLLRKGKIRGVKVGWQWRIPASAIHEFIQIPPQSRRLNAELTMINQDIADMGLCTRASEQDQLRRQTENQEFIPPIPPEDS